MNLPLFAFEVINSGLLNPLALGVHKQAINT